MSTPAPTRGWLTLPNALTLLRIVLTPFFGYFWWRHAYAIALIIFAVAGMTDFLDGLAARLLDQRSALGQFLDPAADKFMVLITFIVAAAIGAVPLWLAVLVIGRDVLLAIGGVIFRFVLRGRFEPDQWLPSRIGKYATFFTLCTVGTALIYGITDWPPLRPFVGAFSIMCAVCVVIAGIQYVTSGVLALRGNAKLAGK